MIKVLVVDDSAVIRQALACGLSKYANITVVGTAPDAAVAMKKIERLDPDVLTLDIEIPGTDGVTFLRTLMKTRPIPAIIFSAFGQKTNTKCIEALACGALDVICKPDHGQSLDSVLPLLIRSIRAVEHIDKKQLTASSTAAVSLATRKTALTASANKIIVIGASTGGTVAIEKIVSALPAATPAIAVVQHMPPAFTKSFADRLQTVCPMEVKEARQGDALTDGRVLIAPGNYHMVVKRREARYFVEIKSTPPVHYQRPSVDVLFHSAARCAGSEAIGVLLTGMGVDGALGLLEMKEAGAQTIAQDRKSSVVFGMPGEAIRIGAAAAVAPLSDIARIIVELLSVNNKKMRME